VFAQRLLGRGLSSNFFLEKKKRGEKKRWERRGGEEEEGREEEGRRNITSFAATGGSYLHVTP
jgi:hypothetical protein